MKSIFTKLSTLLLCGAVALVGCTDYSEDIQAVDKNVNDLKTEFEGYKTSTAATIAELQSAINALEAAQEQMAADYAKKSELETAVATLQSLVNEKAEALQAALTDAAGKIAALEAGKADKAVVEQLQKDVTKAIEDANAAIAALDAAKADKAELELVKADVATLIQGYTQTVQLLQNISNTLTTVQSDLDLVEEDVESLKTAAAEAVYAITNLQAAVDAISTRVSVLETELASAKQEISQHTAALTNILGRLEAVEGNLEDEAAARAEADKLLNDAVLLLDRQFRNLEIDFKTYVEEMEAYKQNLEKEIDELKAQDSALAKSILSYYEQSIAAVDSAVKDLRDEIAALKAEIIAAWELEKAALHNMIADIQKTLEAWCQENTDAIDELRAQDAQLAQIIIDNYELLVALIDKGDADLKTYTDEQIVLLYNTVMDWLKTLNIVIEENNAALLEKITKNYTDLSNQIVAASDELAYQIKVLRSNLDYDIAVLNEKVDTLLNRVQSLVYVPEYSDHKATLEWATVAVAKGAYPTILSQASELKYLVKAEDAVKVAASIAEKPEVLDYVVKGVQTRSAEADLEIVNVEAEGEYIIVSVVAKNFDNEFFTNPEEGIYSAALVFDNEGNTRTTEFTNLVPAEQHTEFEMDLFFPGEDGILVRNEKDVINFKMVCNDSKTVETAVQPVLGFVNPAAASDPATVYTVADMVNVLGYDVTVDTAITLVDTENKYNHDGTIDVKPGPIHIDPYFNIQAGDPLYDFHYSVKEGVSFEHVGKKSTVTYTYTCGGALCTLTYEFELANAQVAINAEVDVEWTVALQESLINNGVQYGKALPFEVKEFTSVGGAVTNLWSALSQDKKETKNYVMVDEAWVESKKIISNKKLTETEAIYQLAAEKYSWNNSYKVVFVTTNDELNVDYTTTIVVNLVGKPDVINVPAIDVDLLLNGNASFFGADVDLLGASYAEIEKYLGYADAAADKAAWAAEFENFKAQNVDPKCAKVNGKVGRASTLNELAEARLSIAEHNNGRYEILVDATNVITFSAEAWFGVPFNFTVNANVVLPEVGLIYSEDYVKDQNTNPYAFADAAIKDGVYSIIKSDVAKYFNVAAESLEGHTYTVNFEVLSPEGDVVSLARNSTIVEPKGASTYHYLAAGVDLDWKNYTGLEVNVKATLLVNGLALESRTLRIVAEDPLTLTVADFDVTRLHRENTIVNVYDHVIITSTEEPEKTNILTIAEGNDFDATVEYAKDTYGVDLKLVLDPQGVYYFNNSGNKVYVGSNKFKYENGVLTIYGDDSVVKNYYAEFTAVMSSRICKGEHRESFRITIKK